MRFVVEGALILFSATFNVVLISILYLTNFYLFRPNSHPTPFFSIYFSFLSLFLFLYIFTWLYCVKNNEDT